VRFLDNIKNKIENINNYLLNSNCSDFSIRHFDGSKLYLIGSFDLCYYHEIEIIFHEVFRLDLETSFGLDLTHPPFQFNIETFDADKMVEIFVVDNCNTKQSIICENIDFNIGIVKYHDEAGKLIL
jgi:hypothetical protein